MAKRKGAYVLPQGSPEREEIRRLTQLANRRIETATKAYEKAGLKTVPSILTGGKQLKEQWLTEKRALSRRVVFESEKEYKQHLEFLRSFDPKDKKGRREKRPTMTQYAKIQQQKTLEAIENVLGISPAAISAEMVKKIKKMKAAELSAFWVAFSEKASRMGAKYSSDAAMNETLSEFFPEDMQQFNNAKAEEAMVEQYKYDMLSKR